MGLFRRMPHVPLGPFKCPACDVYTEFHCKPWVHPIGHELRTGTICCTWRVCPRCHSFGQPGGQWITPSPSDPTEE